MKTNNEATGRSPRTLCVSDTAISASKNEFTAIKCVNRRILIGRILAGMSAIASGKLADESTLGAQETLVAPPQGGDIYLADEIDLAVFKAIDHLIQLQTRDGAIYNLPNSRDRRHATAMTALAVMAMAAIGTAPDTIDPRGIAMSRALEYVLKPEHQDKHGYFGAHDRSRMYGHGIVTLMLTEMLGMGASIDQNERIHTALSKAIKLILVAQKVPKQEMHRGGWRYNPTSTDSDLSVSVWQLMALRSAKNDGLDVPGDAIELALQYLRNSYASSFRSDGAPRDTKTGFSYTPGTQHPSFTMSAAGLLAMQVCGQYESLVVKGASDWLMDHPPKENERFFYYGLYYYSQAMHQAGGKYAKEAERRVPDLLLDLRRADGSWLSSESEERDAGSVYATSMAVLSLSVRYHYLPIYQR